MKYNFEWEIVFEKAILNKGSWNIQKREERIDPLHPDNRYGLPLTVRLVDLSNRKIIWEVAIPNGALPICWNRNRQSLGGEIEEMTHHIGWQADRLRYIVPICDNGEVGKAFLEVGN